MILLFGGTGTLGKELQQLDSNIIAPTKAEVDISSFDAVANCIDRLKPKIVINAAAEINNRQIENDPYAAIETNICGSAFIALHCLLRDIRLVYISTDYIYSGKTGNYKETDEIQPTNLYAWTKLGGECSAKCVKNHLIIRTSFGKTKFDYEKAFDDKLTSKDYVDIIAPKILKAAESDLTGVLNIGTEKKSMYEYASRRNEVGIAFSDHSDHSLDQTKYHNYLKDNL